MNHLERFRAICRNEPVDYVPIFGFPGAPGMAGGCREKTHDRLIATGMPAQVGGRSSLTRGMVDLEGWRRFWGTTGPMKCDISLGKGAPGFKKTHRIEGEYEIIESESGAITRQVLDNDITYSMPEFVRYPVRDRASWEFYKERTTPTRILNIAEVEDQCRQYDRRDLPLLVSAGSTWGGGLRSLMGTELACTILYDDPELAHEILDHQFRLREKTLFPLIERLRPEIIQAGEDCCYNHGCLISPKHFEAFCSPFYRRLVQLKEAVGAEMVAVDCDGNVMELVHWLAALGVNALFPFEVKAGNDLFALRESHPEFIMLGWLEKEVINEGNEAMIEPEIRSKVPPLLETGRYFPNGDHGIQPLVTYDNLCIFMTLLHEVTGNPEGEFPRKEK
jgi:hypothetical protein